jgi:hypothetical protein
MQHVSDVASGGSAVSLTHGGDASFLHHLHFRQSPVNPSNGRIGSLGGWREHDLAIVASRDSVGVNAHHPLSFHRR